MQTLGSPGQATAEERKAILDQRLAAAVAAGQRVEWWGRGTFEAIVSDHRYLPERPWGYALPLLLLTPFVLGPSARDLAGGLRPVVDLVIIVVFFGAIGLWAGRTRYERIAVGDQGEVTVVGAGFVRTAAALTLLAGLAGAIPGAAHLQGVIAAATSRGYAYDVRLASLLLLGFAMVLAGVVCLTAVRGLAYGQRGAWDRALIGSVLLVLATVPMTPIAGQGEMAAAVAFPAILDIFVLLAARMPDDRQPA